MNLGRSQYRFESAGPSERKVNWYAIEVTPVEIIDELDEEYQTPPEVRKKLWESRGSTYTERNIMIGTKEYIISEIQDGEVDQIVKDSLLETAKILARKHPAVAFSLDSLTKANQQI